MADHAQRSEVEKKSAEAHHATKTGDDDHINFVKEVQTEVDSSLKGRFQRVSHTEDSLLGVSHWCLENRENSNVIIETWLTEVQQSTLQKRLTLLQLASYIIQRAKLKSYPNTVAHWAYAVQEATPHLRTTSSPVSTEIRKIFKKLEEKEVYSKTEIADILSVLSTDRIIENSKSQTFAAPAEEVSAFEPSSFISKVKLACRRNSHLGVTFLTKKFMEIDMGSFKARIKDRTQGFQVITRISQYLDQLKASEAVLSTEVDERRDIVNTAISALIFYENVRGEAKIVNAAYKNFTTRVMSTKEKVDEKIKAFDEMEGTISHVPSPPAVAPSPPPDEEEFGVRLANMCGGTNSGSNLPVAAASYIEVIHNNTKEIPTEPTSTSSIDQSLLNPPYKSITSVMNCQPQHTNPIVSQYDTNQANQYQTITSMQQLQQAWSTSEMADTYATMSMSMPNLNFMQQFQQPAMPINFSEPTGYDPSAQYNSQTTPAGIAHQARFHPYGNDQSQRGLNGSASGNNIEPYIPQQSNNTFEMGRQSNNRGDTWGGMPLTNQNRGAGGMKHVNDRGHHMRGSVSGIRGGLQNSRGFLGGFRGVRGGGGMVTGARPPRGRGRFYTRY